ncbi:MAG: proteasome accessory factor PafA2 family protein, partial [Nitrospirae bacterium]|nr:proteasome accessory factor PafA2 family protein [Nitrospirota bacterium]
LAEVDQVLESMELVRAYLNKPFRQEWDYSVEDPRQDARGFRAQTLAQDDEESAFEKADRKRPFSFHEMKSDLALTNGARFYNDHTHPEYSTPECRSLKDLIIHDKAGERILQECANRRNAVLGGPHVQLYKNNTDFHGHSYGCHDNYLLPRSIPFHEISLGLIPFLVTRQIFAGAGKIGIENGSDLTRGHFQLSQRADFFEVEQSVDTMDRRPILNTRDEPHADPSQFRRLHQILGDSNLSETSTALKVGTTWLILRLIEAGALPKKGAVDQPVATLREVSLDPTCKKPIRLVDGQNLNPIDHQRIYLEASIQAFGKENDPDTQWILKNWEEVLNDLEKDPLLLTNRLDWVAKKWLMETFVESEGCKLDDARLIAIDLEYHNMSPDRGLFIAMEMNGSMNRLSSDPKIKEAIYTPPTDTRAAIRGLCVDRFHDKIHRIQWERIIFNKGLLKKELDLSHLFDPDQITSLKNQLNDMKDISQYFSKGARQ